MGESELSWWNAYVVDVLGLNKFALGWRQFMLFDQMAFQIADRVTMLGTNEYLVVGIVANDRRHLGKNLVGWVVVVVSSLSPTVEIPCEFHGCGRSTG